MTYAEEKLSQAIYECLAIGKGDARARLAKSFQFFLHPLREEHFSSEHWKRFNKVKNRLTINGPLEMGEKIIVGSFENSKRGMRNKTASRLIEALVTIYQELSNEKFK